MLFVVATFLLVITGGNVTSRDAGMSVPDGFTVYGYNLFTFPVHKWVGNIKHEHIHRLKGSVVGMMAIVLMVWVMVTQDRRYWLRALAVTTLGLIVLQGIMGGLRVDKISTAFAILHGIHAQIILAVTVLIAAALSRYWMTPAQPSAVLHGDDARRARFACYALIAALLLQLVLGAAMRHTASGLAIPDFPSSYGQLVPPLNQHAITESLHDMLPYDQQPVVPFTPAQVGVHFAHRVWALGVVVALLGTVAILARGFKHEPRVRRPLIVLVALTTLQIALGASVIWLRRMPDVATAHQACGALILAVTALVTYRVHLFTGGASITVDRTKALASGVLPEGGAA